MMARLLLIAFGFGTALDFFMSVLGMAVIFQANSVLSYVICVAAAFAFATLGLCMERIHAKSDKLHVCLQRSWILAVLLNFFAVANAVAVHIVQKETLTSTVAVEWTEVWKATPTAVTLVSLAIVLFLVSAPMFLSYLLRDYFTYSPDASRTGPQPQQVRATS